MEIKLKELLIENFKGIKRFKIAFSDKTQIWGQNASGKTSIFDAFCWLLFNKDSAGREKFNVRPLDSAGRRIDNIEIMVEALLQVDGKELRLKKVQKQNWVKQRGTGVITLQGNPNSLEVNGLPYTETEYKAYISGLIDEKLFKLVTNPKEFVSMKWQEQRKILMQLISDVTDADVIASNPEFSSSELSDLLSDGVTVDRLNEKCKKTLSGLKKTQNELPARIDEVSRQIVDIDVAELELHRNMLLEQIEDAEKRMEDSGAVFEDYQKKVDQINEVRLKISQIEQSEKEKLSKRRASVQERIDLADRSFDKAQGEHSKLEEKVKEAQGQIRENDQKRKLLGEDYRKTKEETLDEGTLICPTCGQEFPTEKKEVITKNFAVSKQQQMQEAVDKANSLKKKSEELDQNVESYKKQIEQLKADKIKYMKERNSASLELDNLPLQPDLSDNQEYEMLCQEVKAMQEVLDGMNSGANIRSQIKIQLSGLREELTEVERKIFSSDNSKIEERIEELKQEQLEVAQKVADQEKQQDLLERFIRTKMEMLSSKINSKFRIVGFRLFENQLNGGMKECCEATINDIPYSDLNSAGKLQAGLDIVNTLQNMHGAFAPVWLDNAESVNDFNLPELDAQMIMLSVSADKELRVEV